MLRLDLDGVGRISLAQKNTAMQLYLDCLSMVDMKYERVLLDGGSVFKIYNNYNDYYYYKYITLRTACQ